MNPPIDYDLPYESWRPGQPRAIRAIENARTKFSVVQAPTGTGKSAIVLGTMKRDRTRAVALTATKGLQDQYQAIAPWLTDLRGMANYPCLAARDEFKDRFPFANPKRVTCDQGPCKLDQKCTLKLNGCEYFDQYREFLGQAYGLTNYAYWLASHRYGQGLGQVSRLFCDEAHAVADQIASACQLRVPGHEVKGRAPKTIDGWRLWASQQIVEGATDDRDVIGRLRVRTRRERYETMQHRLGKGWAWAQDGDQYLFEPIDVRALTGLLFDHVAHATS